MVSLKKVSCSICCLFSLCWESSGLNWSPDWTHLKVRMNRGPWGLAAEIFEAVLEASLWKQHYWRLAHEGSWNNRPFQHPWGWILSGCPLGFSFCNIETLQPTSSSLKIFVWKCEVHRWVRDEFLFLVWAGEKKSVFCELVWSITKL